MPIPLWYDWHLSECFGLIGDLTPLLVLIFSQHLSKETRVLILQFHLKTPTSYVEQASIKRSNSIPQKVISTKVSAYISSSNSSLVYPKQARHCTVITWPYSPSDVDTQALSRSMGRGSPSSWYAVLSYTHMYVDVLHAVDLARTYNLQHHEYGSGISIAAKLFTNLTFKITVPY